MKRLSLALLVFFWLCAAATARAEEAGTRGPELGLRTGFSRGFGKIQAASGSSTRATTLGDNVVGVVPLWLDAGYRFGDRVYLGAFGAYGIALPNHGDNGVCPADDSASCAGGQIRFGIDAMFHLAPRAPQDPWIGLGVGYELLILKSSLDGADLSDSVRGPELLDLQAGVDFRLAQKVAFGPFLSTVFARYSNGSTSETDPSGNTRESSSRIANPTFHAWLSIGVRARYDLGF